MGCVNVKGSKKGKEKKLPGLNDPRILAAQTIFSINEVEALAEVFRTMSESIVPDGKISKEEFKLALFNNSQQENMLADRMFTLFDKKKKGKIDFEDFIRSISFFHPNTPLNDKIDFSFKVYDLNNNGFIEREEVRHMLTASEVSNPMSDEEVELVINKTFLDADLNRDGQIDPNEWRTYVTNNPTMIDYMTVPALKDVTVLFPDFIWKTVAKDSECESSAAAAARVAQPTGGSTPASPNTQQGVSTSATPAAQHGGAGSAATPVVDQCESSAIAEARVAKPTGGSTSAAPNAQHGVSTSAMLAAQHRGSDSAAAPAVAQPEGPSSVVAPIAQPEDATSAAPDAQLA